MAYRLLRDPEANGGERSEFPILSESGLGDNPIYSAIGRSDVNRDRRAWALPSKETLKRRRPLRPLCTFYIVEGECRRGADCPFRHEIKDGYCGDMPSLDPPVDQSTKTLFVRGLPLTTSEQDLRDHFNPHGEIESIRFTLGEHCAYVTYTTREGAEKAAQQLCNKLEINGWRLILRWGLPQASNQESQGSEEARQQSIISQQHNQVEDQYVALQYYD